MVCDSLKWIGLFNIHSSLDDYPATEQAMGMAAPCEEGQRPEDLLQCQSSPHFLAQQVEH